MNDGLAMKDLQKIMKEGDDFDPSYFWWVSVASVTAMSRSLHDH